MIALSPAAPRAVAGLFVCLAALGGCGGGGTQVASDRDLVTSNIDTSDRVYAADRVLQIDVSMDPDEYDAMRAEGRSFPSVFAGCWAEFPGYSHYRADVTIDGESFPDVDIRKKGFLGSLSSARPSIKLNFDTHAPGRRLESLERLTLNNDRQDPSHTHQCIVYDMFRDYGLAAPRCNFAQVSVNGQDLGIYSNVEAVKKHFLRRNYSNPDGNLYEAQVADFGDFTKVNFQVKSNELTNDRSDLDRVVEALRVGETNLVDQLRQIVDLEQFISFWAMETVTGHWDGAAGNANNFLIYHEPDADRFHHLPWGTDGAMALGHPFRPNGIPLYRYTLIPSRLYTIAEQRERYHARVLDILDNVWDATELHGAVDRIRDLTGTPEGRMRQTRRFIDEQETRLRSAVAGDIPQTEYTKSDRPTVCNDGAVTTVSGSFIDGQGSFQFIDADSNTIVVPAHAFAPEDQETNVEMNAYADIDGVEYFMAINIEGVDFGSEQVLLQGVSTTLQIYSTATGDWETVGIAGNGRIDFEESPQIGVAPSYSFSAPFWLRLPGERF